MLISYRHCEIPHAVVAIAKAWDNNWMIMHPWSITYLINIFFDRSCVSNIPCVRYLSMSRSCLGCTCRVCCIVVSRWLHAVLLDRGPWSHRIAYTFYVLLCCNNNLDVHMRWCGAVWSSGLYLLLASCWYLAYLGVCNNDVISRTTRSTIYYMF